MNRRIVRWLIRLRDLVRALNRSPGAEWRDRLVHHGFRALTILGVALLLPVLFPRATLPEFAGLVEGGLADRDVIAEIPFAIYKSEAQLAAERRDAEQSVPPVFALDPTAADTATQRVHLFFLALDSVAATLELSASAEGAPEEGEDRETAPAVDYTPLRDLLERIGLSSPTDAQLAFLADASMRGELHTVLEREFTTRLPRGVALSAEYDEARSGNVVIRRGGQDSIVARESIVTALDFYDAAIRDVPAGRSPEWVELFHTFLVLFYEPSLRLDRDATLQSRERARSAVSESAGSILAGEKIVEARTRIGRAEIDKIQSYQRALVEEGLADPETGFWRGLGVTLFGLPLRGLLGAVLYFFRLDIYENVRSFSVLIFLVLLVLIASAVIAGTGSPPALIPIAFAALLVGALFDSLLALVVVTVVAALLLGQPAFEGLEVPFLTLAAGATAALSIREVHRRSQSWVLIALITGSYLLVGLILLLLGTFRLADLGQVLVWGFGNATLSTALAMGAALPMLERFTGRTTDHTLLELADLNRPLLRRLSREAPGTYAHSINVANLAEAACDAIGADVLLTRVGTYYHDIGKLLRPQYFIENQPKGLNPHDRLRPTLSAQVLREHVREGLKLAEEAKLPSVIKDFIREHHGTQKIAYFYAKAREEEPELELDPNDFCYPGPKPQSRETAVLLLADAVESAARTLDDPSPERIRALIERLVEARVSEDQLDECLLTLRDLDVVKTEFAHVLTGLYHRRIDYPTGGLRTAAATSGRTDERNQALAGDTGPAPSLEPRGRSSSVSSADVVDPPLQPTG